MELNVIEHEIIFINKVAIFTEQNTAACTVSSDNNRGHHSCLRYAHVTLQHVSHPPNEAEIQ